MGDWNLDEKPFGMWQCSQHYESLTLNPKNLQGMTENVGWHLVLATLYRSLQFVKDGTH